MAIDVADHTLDPEASPRFRFVAYARLVTWIALALVAAPFASAQPVALVGKLQIGFSDDMNYQTGFPSNAAVPVCAGAGPLVNTASHGTTLGTLGFYGLGDASPGVGGAITFNAVGGANGGARQVGASIGQPCAESRPPFTNWRIRSFTELGVAHFPGRKGKWTPNISTAPVPATPTATYRVSAGGGLTQPVTLSQWTTTNEIGLLGAMGTPPPTAMNTFMGAAFEVEGVATQSDPSDPSPIARIQPGPNRFGGGVPYSGVGGLRAGLNISPTRPTPPFGFPTNYGQVAYSNGFLPFGPQFLGTDRKGIDTTMAGTLPPPPTSYTNGFFFRREDRTRAFRTPGGSTANAHGAIQTLNGGNTITPMSGAFPSGVRITTPIQVAGHYFEWTTGAVTHSNQHGEFKTVRKAQGYDVAVAPSTAIAGETRRLQLVTPWLSTVRPVGTFGFPFPEITRGGIAILRIDVIPAPEPGFAIGLALGALGAVLHRARRR